jgi:hypothetical protein
MAIAVAREKGYAAGGVKGMWESELPVQKEFFARGSVSAFDLGRTYAELGNKQEAMRYAQISFSRREANLLVGDQMPGLADTPDYQKLLAEVQIQLAR